jgi:hypothetical protein
LGSNRRTAEIGVFVISAMIHEVIVAWSVFSACQHRVIAALFNVARCSSFRFWYPALLVMFGGPGFMFMSLTRKFAAKFANVLLWLLLSVGLGLLTVMYSRELYARYGHEWQGMPGIPATAPYIYNELLHPNPDWNVLDWLAYIFIPRSWLELTTPAV